jgi:hypothetical protein
MIGPGDASCHNLVGRPSSGRKSERSLQRETSDGRRPRGILARRGGRPSTGTARLRARVLAGAGLRMARGPAQQKTFGQSARGGHRWPGRQRPCKCPAAQSEAFPNRQSHLPMTGRWLRHQTWIRKCGEFPSSCPRADVVVLDEQLNPLSRITRFDGCCLYSLHHFFDSLYFC